MRLAVRESASRSASFVPVLPTEPVTAITFAPSLARAARARSRRHRAHHARSAAAHRRRTRAFLRATTASPAPASSAAATKSWPSRSSPLIAKKASPLASVRLSMEIRHRLRRVARRIFRAHRLRHFVYRPEGGHENSNSEANAISLSPGEARVRGSRMRSYEHFRRPSMPRHRLMVGKRQHPVADDLAGFMTLAGDQQHVTGFELGDAGADRLARGRRSRVAPGAAARMAARMAAASSLRGLSSVTMTRSAFACGDAPHDRPLARVAVAAGAEHHDKPAARIRPQRFERLFQRIGLVRVIDENRRAVAVADEFEPALGALRFSSAANTRAGSPPVAMASPAATSAFSTWNAPTSGNLHRVRAVAHARACTICAKPSIGCRPEPDVRRH